MKVMSRKLGIAGTLTAHGSKSHAVSAGFVCVD